MVKSQLTFLHINTLLFQQFSQFLNLFFEFSDKFRVRVFVDDGFANYLFRSVCVSVVYQSKNNKNNYSQK